MGEFLVVCISSLITFEPIVPQKNYALFWKAGCCSFPKLGIFFLWYDRFKSYQLLKLINKVLARSESETQQQRSHQEFCHHWGVIWRRGKMQSAHSLMSPTKFRPLSTLSVMAGALAGFCILSSTAARLSSRGWKGRHWPNHWLRWCWRLRQIWRGLDRRRAGWNPWCRSWRLRTALMFHLFSYLATPRTLRKLLGSSRSNWARSMLVEVLVIARC